MQVKLSRDDVLYIAKLARLHIPEAGLDSMKDQLNEILNYVQMLSSVDISGLEPTDQVTGLTNVFREDEELSYGYEPEELLKNVPKSLDGYIETERVIE